MIALDTKRGAFEILRAQLELERSSFIALWKDLGDNILPMRPRFYTSDVNRGDRRNQKIIDSTASLASRTLRAGMMGGVTSPARPWFRLTIAEPELAENQNVKSWLNVVSTRMSTVFLRSNLYNSLPVLYGDLGTFATSAMLVEEDFDTVIRTYPLPIGSYYLANDAYGRVNVFMREFQMTVAQIVEKFARKLDGTIDWSKLSMHVKSLYEAKNLEQWIEVVHYIGPNNYWDEKRFGSKFKKWRSVYYERGTQPKGTAQAGQPAYDADDKLLSSKGYDFFPILAPRWEKNAEDVYGTDSPGIDALGDVKQLQMGERRIAQAIEKLINPPMKGPTSMRGTKSSIIPGDMTYVDERSEQKGYAPIYQIDPRIDHMEAKQQQVRQRVSRAYYEDLFLMLANSDRRDITAREIEERHQEKLLALGPVLEQLNQDLLDPLIDITFAIMSKQGMIPEAPQEIQGLPLRVEYISIMAQAQKLAGIDNLERLTQFGMNIIATVPSAADKLDFDQILDEYAEIISAPPGVIRSDEDVANIRAGRAQAEQQAAQAEMVAQQAQSARNLSQANLDGNNALTALINQSEAGQLTAM